MRKVLLSAAALGLAFTVQLTAASPARAEPGFRPAPGLIQPVQYRDWRWREREHRRHEWERRHRHQEWRRQHEFQHGW